MTEEEPKAKKNYRRDKPWDNEDIDHWKVEVNISPASSLTPPLSPL